MNGSKGKWMVTQILTEKCNLDCRMCFQSQIRIQKNPELSLSSIYNFYQKHHKEIMAVNITGGEPFFRSDCMDVLETLDTLKIVISINTNGTLLTEEKIDRLARLSYLRNIIISVDGSKEVHESIRKKKGSYDKTISSINLLIKKVPARTLQVNTMIMPETVSGLDNHIDLIESLGVNRFELIFPGSYSEEEQKKSVAVLSDCGLKEITINTVDDTSLRLLNMETIETVRQVIQNHPQSRINVVPKTVLKNFHSFIENKPDSFSVDCTKLRRKELRIDSSGRIVFCDTLRVPLGNYKDIENLGDILTTSTFEKLKKAISYGLPCCNRCCKSSKLVMKQQAEPKTMEGAVCPA